jgi:hypothetical protein
MSSKKKTKANKGDRKTESQYRSNYTGGFQDSSRVKLKYTTLTSGSTSTVTGICHTFRGNDVFDPDFTGVGSQPYNFDDWAVQYARYRVWGSTIEVIPTCVSGSNYLTLAYQYVVLPKRASTVVDTHVEIEDAMVMPYSHYGIRSGNTANIPPTDAKIHGSMTTMRIMGLTKMEFLGGDDYAAAVTTNPAAPWFWTIAFHNLDGSSTCNIYYRVIITYDVEFYNRKEQTIDSLTADLQLRVANRLAQRKAREEKEHPPPLTPVSNPVEWRARATRARIEQLDREDDRTWESVELTRAARDKVLKSRKEMEEKLGRPLDPTV